MEGGEEGRQEGGGIRKLWSGTQLLFFPTSLIAVCQSSSKRTVCAVLVAQL